MDHFLSGEWITFRAARPFGADTVRGYELADFAEVFARYLPEPEQVEQAEQPDLFSMDDEQEGDAA